MNLNVDEAVTSILEIGTQKLRYVDVARIVGHRKIPVAYKILLENVLRHGAEPEAIDALLNPDDFINQAQIPFKPARVVMQDMAGAPVLHDLVTLRKSVEELGGDPTQINPSIQCDLIIDHSVIVDDYGHDKAFFRNSELEFERNEERFRFLKWGQEAFKNLNVVPPGVGIIHQVNIEHLTKGALTAPHNNETFAYLDSCIGTDSHTTMVNGLGVLGWGVGGIEATAALLGESLPMILPPVVGVEISGSLPEGTTATDVVLSLTEVLRCHNVVGKIVEFYGPGLEHIPTTSRTTISNMSPEFGSTAAMFPIDSATIDYYRITGRSNDNLQLIESLAKAQGLWHTNESEPAVYSENLKFDLSSVVPSIAGPYRPQDRISLDRAKSHFRRDLQALALRSPLGGKVAVDIRGEKKELSHGSLAIAAITSCTNTSNPHVMMTAALVAKKAVERGLSVPAWVKTSMAPGSQVVTHYLNEAGVLTYLEDLGFHIVGYGCTTCMGNSGPIEPALSKAVQEHDLLLTSILSGNRNFEGRINSEIQMNYLASPPLVVAYALAGSLDTDMYNDPLGIDRDGNQVFLADLWPSPKEVSNHLNQVVTAQLYLDNYSQLNEGSPLWQNLQVSPNAVYDFDSDSTYLQTSPFLSDITLEPEPIQDLADARVLAKLGNSVTTDHISPVGQIARNSAAGEYLIRQHVPPRDFNTYGARRGNHEVMVRGTFANIRLRNHLVPGVEGGYTRLFPENEITTIFEASTTYASRKKPLIILAGSEYGSGSARDYAAKGSHLLGIRVVLAESFERIHRSNLVGMGIIPLQYEAGDSAESLGIDGTEEFSIFGLASLNQGTLPTNIEVKATKATGQTIRFYVRIRIDTPTEVAYVRHGGILPYILRTKILTTHQERIKE